MNAQVTWSGVGRFAVPFTLALTLFIGAGCSVEALIGLLPTPGDVRVVGESSGSAILVPRDDAEILDGYATPGFPAAREIINLDLDSSDIFNPVTVSGATSSDVIASGRWIAWLDRETRSVHVFDSTTAKTAVYFDGDEALNTSATIHQIDGDRLLIHHTAEGTENEVAPEYQFIVLDLNTGAQVVVAGGWDGNTGVLSGDWLAYMSDENVDVEILSLEIAAHVNAVNLITSEFVRIAPNIRVSGYEPALFIADGQVIWQQFKDGNFKSRIELYDLASKKRKTLIEDFDGDETRRLVDAADGRLMILRTEGNPLAPSRVTLQTRTIGKDDAKTIAEYKSDNALFGPKWFEPEPALLEGFASWTNPQTGRLTSYDLATGATRVYTLPD